MKEETLYCFSLRRCSGDFLWSTGVAAIGPLRYCSKLENQPSGRLYLLQEYENRTKPWSVWKGSSPIASPMKGETLDWCILLRISVAAIVDAVPVLRKLVLRVIIISLKMSPRVASNSQYCKRYVDFCVDRKYWGNRVVRGREKGDKNKTGKEKWNVGVRGNQK